MTTKRSSSYKNESRKGDTNCKYSRLREREKKTNLDESKRTETGVGKKLKLSETGVERLKIDVERSQKRRETEIFK
jgi:hypothetical protein